MNTVTLFFCKERVARKFLAQKFPPYLSGMYYYVYKLVVKYKKKLKTLNDFCSPCS